jgi:hypothetical protein
MRDRGNESIDQRQRSFLKVRGNLASSPAANGTGSFAVSRGTTRCSGRCFFGVGIDKETRRVYVHCNTRRGRRQLRTRGAANADGGSAQAPTLSAFGLVCFWCSSERPKREVTRSRLRRRVPASGQFLSQPSVAPMSCRRSAGIPPAISMFSHGRDGEAGSGRRLLRTARRKPCFGTWLCPRRSRR